MIDFLGVVLEKVVVQDFPKLGPHVRARLDGPVAGRDHFSVVIKTSSDRTVKVGHNLRAAYVTSTRVFGFLFFYCYLQPPRPRVNKTLKLELHGLGVLDNYTLASRLRRSQQR